MLMLYVAIVIYNKKLSDVLSRYSAKRLLEKHGEKKTKIIVVDNSDKSFYVDDEELNNFVATHGIVYIKNGKNLGLSKAYNKAVEYALHDSTNPKFDFLMLLDDDTDITYDYIREIYKEYKAPSRVNDGVNVITGLIESGGNPMSPVRSFTFNYHKSNCIRKPGIYDDVYCISSGMAVRLSAIEMVGGFEEALFLDMIDYTFLYNLSRHDLNRMLVINARIEQSFSGRTKQDRRLAMKRYKIYKKDFMKFCELTGKNKWYGRLHLLKRKIALEIKNRK